MIEAELAKTKREHDGQLHRDATWGSRSDRQLRLVDGTTGNINYRFQLIHDFLQSLFAALLVPRCSWGGSGSLQVLETQPPYFGYFFPQRYDSFWDAASH